MNEPIAEVIRKRFSCRAYLDKPIEEDKQRMITEFLNSDPVGRFGTRARLALVAATEHDRQSLKGLGTYGFIRGATGFIVGAVEQGPKNLEDFGYIMEQAILFATDMGLGTCWLGGGFTKSSFAKKISATREETVPAVTAIGYTADGSRSGDRIRRRAGSDHRLPMEQLFFDRNFGEAINPDDLGAYAEPLEMVRWAPSASNKQPWRVIRNGDTWHFYLQRTQGYGKGSLVFRLLRLADLQRVDMGIAMCHFELTARELGLTGRWVVDDPGSGRPGTEYTASWIADNG
ncbi:MAG TPA: nitroreductase family protein [Methylomusa anaerophila]|uniref:Nitroreductase family protein n=1 Tax=Methylomusa anaerophila TaxID=1930071 RepID=A0A348AEP1_9FIRM|nr:nitroreductase family protein [Methylomusa anaerophila]BBB89539.1 nitroreductase family protein [Methylomusa anaerophila]HML90091.1 nitroreductase family protein [Methylomusa anaerophila]